MCPFKCYKQRKVIKPWLTAEIYREIRYREKCLKVFRSTGCQHYLELARKSRNSINIMVGRAKSNNFRNLLTTNAKNPKKSWRILKGFTENTPKNKQSSYFVDPESNSVIPENETQDFLNSYFVNIVERLKIDCPVYTYHDFEHLYTFEGELCFLNDYQLHLNYHFMLME